MSSELSLTRITAACRVVMTRSSFHVPALRMAFSSPLRTLLSEATLEVSRRGTRSVVCGPASRRERCLHKAIEHERLLAPSTLNGETRGRHVLSWGCGYVTRRGCCEIPVELSSVVADTKDNAVLVIAKAFPCDSTERECREEPNRSEGGTEIPSPVSQNVF